MLGSIARGGEARQGKGEGELGAGVRAREAWSKQGTRDVEAFPGHAHTTLTQPRHEPRGNNRKLPIKNRRERLRRSTTVYDCTAKYTGVRSDLTTRACLSMNQEKRLKPAERILILHPPTDGATTKNLGSSELQARLRCPDRNLYTNTGEDAYKEPSGGNFFF